MTRYISILGLILMLFISCENANKDFTRTIENEFKLERNLEGEVILSKYKDGKNPKLMISGHILFYTHNSEFIIVNKKESDSVKGFDDLPKHERLLEVFKSNFNEYYILNISEDSVFGPFNKEQYLKMRTQLKIPEGLKLDNSTMEFFTMIQRNDINYFKDLDEEVMNVQKLKGNNFTTFY